MRYIYIVVDDEGVPRIMRDKTDAYHEVELFGKSDGRWCAYEIHLLTQRTELLCSKVNGVYTRHIEL